MGTLNEKLEYLSQTKEYIKEAIISKGQPVSSSDTFRSYASKIAAIENGDIITATNTTGSAVSADDKVWVEPEINYIQNFGIVGSPTIENQIASGFSGIDYLTFPAINTQTADSWEVVIQFQGGITGNSTIGFFSSNNSFSLEYSVGALPPSGRFKLYLCSNGGSSWDIADGVSGSHALPLTIAIKPYYIKLKYADGVYTVSYSEDNETWIEDINISNSAKLYYYKNNLIKIGTGRYDSLKSLQKIHLLYSWTKENNTIWTPYTIETNYNIIPSAQVTSTSFTAVAQTSIANNASGSVKTILDGNGSYAPTLGTKVITRNNTYSASTDDLYGYSSVTVNVEDIPAVVESLSITPTTSAQSFTPTSGVDGYSPVTVSAVDSSIDANITAGNIKSGVEILGVEGTYSGETPVLQDKVILSNGEYTADEGYDGIGTATVAVNATGSTEVATNRTGAAINAGDKVWVNQEYYEAGTIINNNLGGIVSWHGSWPNNGVFTSDCMYGINTSTSNNALYYTPTMTSQGNYYGSAFAGGTDSNLYFKNGINFVRSNSTAYASKKWIRFDTGTPIILGNTVSNLIIPFVNKPGWFTDGSGNLYIIDIATGEVTETITMPACATYDSLLNYAPVYISDEYILLANSSGGYHLDKYSFNPTEKTFTLVTSNVFSYSASNYTPVGITPDNKYIVYFENTKNVMYLLNTNTFEKTTALSGINTVQQTYYASTGVFWCRERNQSSQVYPLNTRAWKYNPESETFIEVQLNTDFFKNIYWLSDDLSKIVYNPQMGSTLGSYKLSTQNRILGNNLVPYSQSTTQTITGTAAEFIAAGASGNVYLGDKGALQSKVAMSNGIVTPSEGYHGLSKVTVNVVGTGVEVEGKNYTGAAINAGDKVWINPTYTEEGTVQEYSNSQNDSSCFTVIRLNENYTFDFWKGRLWNNGVLVGTAQSGCYDSNSYNTNGYHPVFAPDGVVYIYNGSGMQRIDSGLSWYKTSYSLPIFGTSEYIIDKNNSAIVKIDPSTGNEIKRYTTDYTNVFGSCISAIYYGNGKFSMKVSGQTSGWWLCTLDEATNTFSHTTKSYLSNLTEAPIGITSDYKYVICGDNHIYDVSNIENGISDVYTSKNFPAQIASYQNGLYFNSQTDMFCGCGTSSNGAIFISDSNKPEVVYYNKVDETFTKLPLVINPAYSAYCFSGACISNSELVCYSVAKNGYGQSVYTPYLSTITGNNIVPFSQILADTQTGMATESIAVGGTGTVKVGAFFEPVVETLNVTPTTSAQTIIPGTGVDGYNEVLVSAVTSAIDPDITPENIVEGINILGVTGTAEITTLDVTTPRLVVVNNGTDGVAYSDNGGNTWSESEMPVTAEWRSIAFGNGRYVAVAEGSSNTVGAYSDDGINWTQTTMPSGNWYGICYGAGKFVSISYNSNSLAYSIDGINWTSITLTNSDNWNSITYGNGAFVIVGKNYYAYSTDGITWVEDNLPLSNVTAYTQAGDNISVTILQNNTAFAYSEDITQGFSAGFLSSDLKQNWYNLCYGGGTFLATVLGALEGGYITMISSNGTTWTKTVTTTSFLGEAGDHSYDLKTVRYDESIGKFVGLTRNGEYTFTAGTDGIWTVAENDPVLTGNSWNGMCYGEPVTGTTTVDAMLNMINGENIPNYDELDDALHDLNGESA